MSYTFLLDAGEESSAESFSGIPPSVLSKSNPTAAASYSNASGTECCPDSQSGTISEPLPEPLGEDEWMWCAEDSRAKISAPLGVAKALAASVAGYGLRWNAWFAKYNPDTSLWRTAQCSLFGGWDEFSEGWPRWGMMRDGECSEPTMLPAIAKGIAFGLLPRPQKVDGSKWYVVKKLAAENRVKNGRQLMLIHVVGLTAYEHLNRWLANPPFWEAMMGWPIGWTDCTPLGMDKFQTWLRLHGKPFSDE